MKIGIFDSGLGGLIITQAIARHLPEYDYIYLGDTARVPYGNRSEETVYHFTQEAVDYLYQQDCAVIITACNTVSVKALVDIVQLDIPNYYPDRQAIGVIEPTAEAVIEAGAKRVGIIATNGTVASGAYPEALHRLDEGLSVFQQATPLLVPLIENNGSQWVEPILRHYLEPLLQERIDTLILGCTHYPFLKDLVRQIVGPAVTIISQDEVMPYKLAKYLKDNPAVAARLTNRGRVSYLVTDINKSFEAVARTIAGDDVSLRQVAIAKDM